MNISYRMMRNQVVLVAFLAAFIVPPQMIRAQEVSGDQTRLDKVNASIDQALAYLVSKQDASEGCFSSSSQMTNLNTALSCLSLVAAGQRPGGSQYEDNLRRGSLYLARAANKGNGYLGKEGKARMYGHGICMLALCEAYGLMQKEDDTLSIEGAMQREEDTLSIKAAIEKARDVVVKAQCATTNSHSGGWRYQPQPKDSDLSVTVWQILALQSAQSCGIEVPDHVVSNALAYVRTCYGGRQKRKGFCYQAKKNSPSTAMRCAGVVCMLAAAESVGEAEMDMIAESARFLPDVDVEKGKHYYYMAYCIAAAAIMMGEEYSDKVLTKLEDFLIDLQQENGEFKKHSGHSGDVYSTAFATICLSMGYAYVPIYMYHE